MRCAGQVIVGPMGDRIDINVLAVKTIMDLEGVGNQAEVMEQVQTLAGLVFREQALAAEARREADKRDRTGRR